MTTLVFEKHHVAPTAARTLAGVSAATLVAVRPFGPPWIVLVLGVFFVPTTRARLGRIFRSKQGRLWAGALGAVLVLSMLWTLLMHTGEPGMVDPTPISTGQALRYELYYRLDFYARQMVGSLSWNDSPLPALCYVAWFMAFGLLLLIGFGVGDRLARWRLSALIVAAFVILVLPDALEVRTYGFVSQGRYVLPLMVGVPILAAQAIGDRGVLTGDRARTLSRTLAIVLVPIHFIALYTTMLRWQSSLGTPPADRIPAKIPSSPLGGDWLPVLGPELPLVLGALATVVLVGYAFVATAARPENGVVTPQQRRPPIEADETTAEPSPVAPSLQT